MIKAGTLRPVIDKEYRLANVNEAFRMLEEREVFGKVVVKP
jgi:alcohol dehydrogenase